MTAIADGDFESVSSRCPSLVVFFRRSTNLCEDGWLRDCPVWPIRDDQEEALLFRLAQKSGVACVDVGDQVLEPYGMLSRGEVFVFEPSLYEEAHRYAHITRRSLRIGSDCCEIASMPHCEVVFTSEDTISSALISGILQQSSNAGAMAGLICVPSDAPGSSCLAKAFFAAHIPGSPYSAIQIDRSFDGDTEMRYQGRHIVGSDLDAKTLRRLLSSRSSLIAFKGHSDGVDATLSDRAYLCDIHRLQGDDVALRLPACVRANHCRRINMPLHKALRDQRILNVESINARVVVWNTCWGFLPPPHTGKKFGLGLRIGMSEEVGVAITTCNGPVLQNATTGAALIDDLAAGVPAGEAVYRHNASFTARQMGHTMIIVGDPRCVATLPSGPQISTVAVPSDLVHRSIVDPRLALIELTLSSFGQSDLDEDRLKAEFTMLTRGLAEYFLNGKTLPIPRVRVLQDWIFDKLLSTSPFLNWHRKAAFTRREPPGGRCPVCKETHLVSALVGYSTDTRTAPRTLVRCSHCGLAADTPLDSQVSVSVADTGGFFLDGLKSRASAVAMVVVETRTEQLHRSRWPIVDGAISESFRPSILETPGAVDWFVVVLDELDLCVFHGYVVDMAHNSRSSQQLT